MKNHSVNPIDYNRRTQKQIHRLLINIMQFIILFCEIQNICYNI